MPQDLKRIHFAQHQKAASKDVERALGSSSPIQHGEGPSSDMVRKQSGGHHVCVYYHAQHDTPPSHKNMHYFLFSPSHKNMHFPILETLFSLLRWDSFSTYNTLITFSLYLSLTLPLLH